MRTVGLAKEVERQALILGMERKELAQERVHHVRDRLFVGRVVRGGFRVREPGAGRLVHCAAGQEKKKNRGEREKDEK